MKESGASRSSRRAGEGWAQSPFFGATPGTDPTYEALRVPDHPNSARARGAF